MTDHEKAAMKAAASEAYARRIGDGFHTVFQEGWRAGRAYEPPAVCGKQHRLDSCDLPSGHGGDHRKRYGDGSYIGWPRADCASNTPGAVHSVADSRSSVCTKCGRDLSAVPREQEPDPDEQCAYVYGGIPRICGTSRELHKLKPSHAFVSAKEATK